MVRPPLSPEERERGRRLGTLLRQARGSRTPMEVAAASGVSLEALRKIESGRVPTPAFFTDRMYGELWVGPRPSLASQSALLGLPVAAVAALLATAAIVASVPRAARSRTSSLTLARWASPSTAGVASG